VIAQLSDVALDPITQMLGCARVVLEDEVEDAPIAVQSRGSHTGPLYLHLLLH
jgi:hypothetical protein